MGGPLDTVSSATARRPVHTTVPGMGSTTAVTLLSCATSMAMRCPPLRCRTSSTAARLALVSKARAALFNTDWHAWANVQYTMFNIRNRRLFSEERALNTEVKRSQERCLGKAAESSKLGGQLRLIIASQLLCREERESALVSKHPTLGVGLFW